ncbi:uncharacterized protein LOC125497838 [Beta vulgaris subsp. vulgaris]|uniref:uncharacterized protein LOC125497838 n=1 Tax=Beta vulgaris subsp. vulgaris TaxID=3555 RepID=UPI002036CA71|nr:uncharacterized protein LOC125497838 [Beta vulgaris subsp. vulgaris]
MASAKALGDHHSILLAEAMGLYEGIKGAKSLSISNLIIEGSLLLCFDSVSIRHCFREANRAADFMAHKGHCFKNVLMWSPPYCIDFSLLIRKDVLGWPPH